MKWDLLGENDEAMIHFLPVMQTDIYLRKVDKILSIDAKYYGRTLQQQYDKYTLHSGADSLCMDEAPHRRGEGVLHLAMLL